MQIMPFDNFFTIFFYLASVSPGGRGGGKGTPTRRLEVHPQLTNVCSSHFCAVLGGGAARGCFPSNFIRFQASRSFVAEFRGSVQRFEVHTKPPATQVLAINALTAQKTKVEIRVNCGEYEKESVCQVKVALAFSLGFCFVISSQSARLGALKRQASMPRENWDQIQ